MMCSVPKPIALDNVAIRMLFDISTTGLIPFEIQKGDNQYSVIGGVISLDLIELPESPKTINSWLIRPCNFIT
jgi:hypothetical protein